MFKVVTGILDSGATISICGLLGVFHNLTDCHVRVKCANGQIMVCEQMGTVVLSNKSNVLVIRNCLYIPNSVTLISAHQITAQGSRILFENDIATV